MLFNPPADQQQYKRLVLSFSFAAPICRVLSLVLATYMIPSIPYILMLERSPEEQMHRLEGGQRPP